MVGCYPVRAFLQRFFGPRRSRPVLTCYLRENGPIAYELDLFGAEPRDRAAMMSDELAWAWKSGTREWTHLTRISLSAFLADLPAGVLLVASEGELPTEVSDTGVVDWIRRFCRVQNVPLVAVIHVSPERQLLFVQQHASDAVNRLLDAWIDKKAAARKSYTRLGPASLEAIAEHTGRAG
jgi:hypothetical protein